jgi:hypothetical protein
VGIAPIFTFCCPIQYFIFESTGFAYAVFFIGHSDGGLLELYKFVA